MEHYSTLLHGSWQKIWKIWSPRHGHLTSCIVNCAEAPKSSAQFLSNWALTVNLSKTKTRILDKRPSLLQIHIPQETVNLRQTKTYTYLGLIMNTTGPFNKAVNDLRDKARRAFNAIKRNIKLVTPIRIWLKIFDAVIEPNARFGWHSTCRILQVYPTSPKRRGTWKNGGRILASWRSENQSWRGNRIPCWSLPN